MGGGGGFPSSHGREIFENLCMKTAFSCTLNAIIRGSLCSGIDQFHTFFHSFFFLGETFSFSFSLFLFFLFPPTFPPPPFFFIFFFYSPINGGGGGGMAPLFPPPPLATGLLHVRDYSRSCLRSARGLTRYLHTSVASDSAASSNTEHSAKQGRWVVDMTRHYSGC